MLEESIEYTIRKSKRAKRLRLAVYCDGSVIVTTPANIKYAIIQEFVIEKRYWIYEKLRFFRSLDTGQIRVFRKDEYIKHREKALQIAIKRVEYYKKIYEFAYHKINIKNQKTRWGSCSKKGNLNLNYKIIFLPEGIRDYIIVHEICHLLEFNHTKRFWNLVQKGCPDYKDIKRKLREFDLYYK